MYKRTPVTLHIKQTATALGFDHCGISRAVYLDHDAKRLESWLNKGTAFHFRMPFIDHPMDK